MEASSSFSSFFSSQIRLPPIASIPHITACLFLLKQTRPCDITPRCLELVLASLHNPSSCGSEEPPTAVEELALQVCHHFLLTFHPPSLLPGLLQLILTQIKRNSLNPHLCLYISLLKHFTAQDIRAGVVATTIQDTTRDIMTGIRY